VASTTLTRAINLRRENIDYVDPISGASMTVPVVKDFAFFIDTHRDLPHVGMFDSDIHRGTCRPTMVHLFIDTDLVLVKADEPWRRLLLVENKHRFVTVDWWSDYIMGLISEGKEMPFDDRGFMATSHFRDPRAGRYVMRSFRQVVMDRQRKGR
jgi:hypothetical protein